MIDTIIKITYEYFLIIKEQKIEKKNTYHEINNLHLVEFVRENNDAFLQDYLNQSDINYHIIFMLNKDKNLLSNFRLNQ